MSQDLINAFNERYLTKKEIQYRVPNIANIEDFWETIVQSRKSKSTLVPLLDQKNNYFWFNMTKEIRANIDEIEKSATEDIFKSVPESFEMSVIADALIDEAYNSSVIEGAFSTKRRTKEMIEKNLKPINKSEIMILNNYRTLSYILEKLDYPFTENTILSIYKMLTKNTLDKDSEVDKYRNDTVYIWDRKTDSITYTAPDYTMVQPLMDTLLKFTNENMHFHPVIKACIIHFYFVYIHPFFDGNGRTARAISYMYLLQNGYNFFKFFSISSVINEEKNKYYDAIQNTEDLDSDMTYFINYYTSMIVRAILKIKNNFRKEFGRKLIKDTIAMTDIILSKRQYKVINHLITIDKNFITISEYQKRYKVSYETARSDLNELTLIGFFKKRKAGKKFIYVFEDINNIIKNMKC